MANKKRVVIPKDDVVEELKERFGLAFESSKEQRQKSYDDYLFCDPEKQWDPIIKAQRESEGKPVFSFDRINQQVKQITNAQRSNRPAVKINPCNNEADKDTAEVYEGLIRHIEYISGADQAYDTAFDWCVKTGVGYYRLRTAYLDDTTFDQDIIIDRIVNPFSVYIDPAYKTADGSDISWAIISEDITVEDFKEQYQESKLVNFNQNSWMSLGDEEPDWFTYGNSGRTGCRICEYWKKVTQKKTLCKLEDGRSLYEDELKEEDKKRVEAKRDVITESIKWYKCNGIEILDEGEWAGKYIPIIPVFGEEYHLDGSSVYSGMVRNCKTEQLELNIVKNNMLEVIALAPKAPWVGRMGFVGDGDNKRAWETANRVNYPYLQYASADDQGNPLTPPERLNQEPAIQAFIEATNMAENDIKTTNGLYDPSLGNKMANDQSGLAIKALQNQGSLGNYNFSDNLSRAIRLEGLMLIDLIPHIYDTKRTIRIIGIDEEHKMVQIDPNAPVMSLYDESYADLDGVERIFNLKAGKYDVTVSSGPSYQTKRIEDANILFELIGKDPNLMAQYADIVFQALDSPIGLQMTERAQKLLPPQLQPKSKGGKQTLDQLQQQVQEQQGMIQQLTQTLQKETALADKQQNELQIAQLQQQTELLKHKTQMEHDTNKIVFASQMEELKMKAEQSHEALTAIQKHLLAMDMATHNASLDTIPAPQSTPAPGTDQASSQAIPEGQL